MANLPLQNCVKERRLAQQWSQEELARRGGISRSAVSAIESQRLIPSVAAALALAKAFECTVEELFGSRSSTAAGMPQWAWRPPASPWRYCQATAQSRTLAYPVEPTDGGIIEHDGVFDHGAMHPRESFNPRLTLVMATCDPAAGLLVQQLAQTASMRLLVFTRSSQDSLALLGQGLVHIAGVHLSSTKENAGNAAVVREKLGDGYCLLRLAHWQEGLALAPHLSLRSVRSALQAKLRWVGREPGSGARQCLDELLGSRTVRRVARNHRHVAQAIRDGWADAGVCVRLACEEAGLSFLAVRQERFDLCYASDMAGDARIVALQSIVQSKLYRQLLGDLPGYDVHATGAWERV
jgi:molybdate-binding protein/transcriptional regulator with XRE-family HTH domain